MGERRASWVGLSWVLGGCRLRLSCCGCKPVERVESMGILRLFCAKPKRSHAKEYRYVLDLARLYVPLPVNQTKVRDECQQQSIIQ